MRWLLYGIVLLLGGCGKEPSGLIEAEEEFVVYPAMVFHVLRGDDGRCWELVAGPPVAQDIKAVGVRVVECPAASRSGR